MYNYSLKSSREQVSRWRETYLAPLPSCKSSWLLTTQSQLSPESFCNEESILELSLDQVSKAGLVGSEGRLIRIQALDPMSENSQNRQVWAGPEHVFLKIHLAKLSITSFLLLHSHT